MNVSFPSTAFASLLQAIPYTLCRLGHVCHVCLRPTGARLTALGHLSTAAVPYICTIWSMSMGTMAHILSPSTVPLAIYQPPVDVCVSASRRPLYHVGASLSVVCTTVRRCKSPILWMVLRRLQLPPLLPSRALSSSMEIYLCTPLRKKHQSLSN